MLENMAKQKKKKATKKPAKLNTAIAKTAKTQKQSSRIIYAGFWSRFVAWLIDTAVLLLGLRLFEGIFNFTFWNFSSFTDGFFSSIALIACWLYYAFFESSKHQATIGKMALDLKVVDTNLNRLSFTRATGRHFSKLLSILTLGIGFIMIGLTDNKQGLHDKIAETFVIRR